MKKIAFFLVALTVAACASTSKTNTPQATPENPKNPAAATAPASGEPAANATADQSIYFDFDKSIVKPEFRKVILKQAEYLKNHRDDIVTLEGNCDERGSSEYNLGLGQRRADSVKKSLVAAGVRSRQLKTTSFGKEKPRLTCHEEKCWKENRRVDFVPGA